MNLQACISRTSVTDLRAIAQNINLHDMSALTPDRIKSCLTSELSHPEKILDLISRLDSTSRHIFMHVYLEGGRAAAAELRRLWGGDDAEAGTRVIYGRSFPHGIASVRLSGLMYLIRDLSDDMEYYVIPDTVVNIVQYPDSGFLPIHSQIPFQSIQSSLRIMTDIFALIRFLSHVCVRPLRNGALPQRHFRALEAIFSEPIPVLQVEDKPYYSDFIFRITSQLNLIAVSDNRLKESSSFPRWIQKPLPEQIHDIFKEYRNLAEYDEFRIVRTIKVVSSGLRQPAKIVRSYIIQALSRFPSNTWVPISGLVDYFKSHFPHFFRPMISDRHWIVQSIADGISETDSTWVKLEHQVIERFLTGPLTWMGIVAIGLDNQRHPVCFMILPAGEFLLGKTSEPSPDIISLDRVKIMVQPDFEILVPQNTVLHIKYEIEQLAEHLYEGPVNRYRMTRQTICEALDNGRQINAIIDFLQSVSSNPVPQNVEATLRYWSESYGRVNLRHDFILEAENEFLFQEILQSLPIGTFFKRTINPASALIRPEEMNSVVRELKKMGIYPKIEPELRLKQQISSYPLFLTRDMAKSLLGIIKSSLRSARADSDLDKTVLLETIKERIEKLIEKSELTEPGGSHDKS